jgi:hypothetical protein
MTNEPLNAGDTIRLADGTTAVVDSPTITSYTDSTGTHEGPFVGLAPGFHYVRPEEVVAVVARNTNACILCGGGVTSKNPAKYPYCRSCHYTGAATEDLNREHIDALGVLFDDVDDLNVSVEHTGGGCFWLAVRPLDDSPFYWIATDGEASIPDFARGESWGIVCRYADEEQAREVEVDGVLWHEYEGVPLLADEGASDEGVGALTHEQVAKAILADRESLRAEGRLS